MIQAKTAEEWQALSRRLNETADEFEKIIEEHKDGTEHPAWHELVRDLRDAAAAVLYVSYAYPEMRYEILDNRTDERRNENATDD